MSINMIRIEKVPRRVILLRQWWFLLKIWLDLNVGLVPHNRDLLETRTIVFSFEKPTL